jgi:hypothetical protein
MPFDRSGLFSLTFLGGLLVEFTSPKLGEDARFFTGTFEATQGGVKILILANSNAGHSNLNSVGRRRRHSATGGRILKCASLKGKVRARVRGMILTDCEGILSDICE